METPEKPLEYGFAFRYSREELRAMVDADVLVSFILEELRPRLYEALTHPDQLGRFTARLEVLDPPADPSLCKTE